MKSLLEQLGNEQALLMHLADELPPEDAAELEQVLQSDPRLRTEFTALRKTQETIFSSIAQLDRREPMPVTRDMAIRGVRRRLNLTRAINTPTIEPGLAPKPQKKLRYPWWAYPMATAAAVLLAFLAWWGNSSYSFHQYTSPAQTAWNPPDPQGQFARWNARRMEFDPQLQQAYAQARQQRLAQWLQDSFSNDQTNENSTDHPLARAEAQLASLTEVDPGQFPLSAEAQTNQ